MDVLEQAVLDPVGRDEDEARGVPLLRVEQPSHRLGAGRARALDVGDEVGGPAAEGRPRAAVDRPAQARPDLGRVAERRAPGDHAAGDRNAVHVGRRIGQRDVRDDDPAARRPRAAPATSARGSTATRRASAGSRPAGARGCRRRRVPPDRARSGTSAMRPRSATGCTIARRRAGRARSARRGAGARRRQAADPGCPSPLRPIRPQACGWPRALRILTSSLCRCQCCPTRPSSRRGGCSSAALRSPSSRMPTGRRSTSTTRRPCEPGHGPTARRLRATPAAARAAYGCKANPTVGLLRILLDEGMGMDVASEGELAHALAAGAPGELLVVHGNNKSDADVRAAVAAGAGLLVVDHLGELDQVERIAAELGRIQPILLRVTPGIDAATHAKIRTGHASSKFGIAPGEVSARDRRAPQPARTCASTGCTCTSAPRSATSAPTSRRSTGSPGSRGSPSCPCSTSAAVSPSPYTDDDRRTGDAHRRRRRRSRRSPSGSTRCRSSCSSPAARSSAPAA